MCVRPIQKRLKREYRTFIRKKKKKIQRGKRYSLIIKIERQKKLNDFYFFSKITLTVLSCQYPTLSRLAACKSTWTVRFLSCCTAGGQDEWRIDSLHKSNLRWGFFSGKREGKEKQEERPPDSRLISTKGTIGDASVSCRKTNKEESHRHYPT